MFAANNRVGSAHKPHAFTDLQRKFEGKKSLRQAADLDAISVSAQGSIDDE